jgi:hypothetical protein
VSDAIRGAAGSCGAWNRLAAAHGRHGLVERFLVVVIERDLGLWLVDHEKIASRRRGIWPS